MLQPAHNNDPDRRADTDYLPARMLNEFAYCPRLFFLEHVEGLFAHNRYTTEGAARHKRVDKKSDTLPAGDGDADREPIHARSVTLSSDAYGVIAKLDLVETDGNMATPVDYKRGSPRKLDDGTLGAWDPERVQLCVQAMVLRENGYQCDEGILFFWTTRQRVRVPIDAELIALTTAAVEGARQLMDAGQMPPPLVDSPKCPQCSLVPICLPDETTACQTREAAGRAPGQQGLLFDMGPFYGGSLVESELKSPDQVADIRQLVTVRDERKPVYLNTQGYFVGKSGQVLQVKEKGKKVQEIRLKDVSQVNLMGSVQISTAAVQGLLQAEIPLLYFTMGGWFHGMTQSVGLKNIAWRREQFRRADDERFCLRLARQLVTGKILNQRTLLMRNHVEPPADTLRFLKAMAWESERADSLASLLGIEGSAARAYFQQFAGMIKVDRQTDEGPPAAEAPSSGAMDGPDATDVAAESSDKMPHAVDRQTEAGWRTFDFARRNRRPPRDPINALLSLGYSVLAKDLTVTCASVGLDPYMGYFHQLRCGRPALALDLMEPFRALIVDSAVLSAINQRMVTLGDFISAGEAVALTPSGRKAFFHAYEKRMDQLVTHPIFGYRVSYRRVLEIQVRLLARVLLGELHEYPVFTTR